MKTVIFCLLLCSVHAMALTTVEVQECADGSGYGAYGDLNGHSIFRTAGTDIYKISPNANWGSLPTSIFKSEQDKSYCYKLMPGTNPEGKEVVKRISKSSLKPGEIKSCEAHQIGASRITKGELDYVLSDTLSMYTIAMRDAVRNGSETLASHLVKGFEKCENLRPVNMTADFDLASSDATASRDNLMRAYHLKRGSPQRKNTGARPALNSAQ